MIVAGTRPEGIKMAPVWCQLRAMPDCFAPPIFCSTGQHEAMLDSVLELWLQQWPPGSANSPGGCCL
jgi:UDP-N-acetylglucosamine 2-epimerase